MRFVEPEVNRFDVHPPAGSFPNVLEGDHRQVAQLCHVWDANNLLYLIPTYLLGAGSRRVVPPHKSVWQLQELRHRQTNRRPPGQELC